MSTTAEKPMQLTLEPEMVQWAGTHYVFVEKQGPFQTTAPQAWTELHKLASAIAEHNEITGYVSLYKMDAQIYRAGVSVAEKPEQLPPGVAYEKFAGESMRDSCWVDPTRSWDRQRDGWSKRSTSAGCRCAMTGTSSTT